MSRPFVITQYRSWTLALTTRQEIASGAARLSTIAASVQYQVGGLTERWLPAKNNAVGFEFLAFYDSGDDEDYAGDAGNAWL
jgi:hypothetical protein